MKNSINSSTVNFVIEACLLFNFCTFEAVLYLRFWQFLLNKSPNFPDFFGLLFETVFYLKQSSITDLAVYIWSCIQIYTKICGLSWPFFFFF